MGGTGIIVLAAGNSSRMGAPKQLLPYRGQPLVRHAAEIALASGCSPVVIVLGARAGDIAPALAGLPVEVVVNARWEEGIGASIQAGLDTLLGRDLAGVVLALADQPLVTAATLERLVEGHRTSAKPIVAARYAGTAGLPVHFERSYFSKLFSLAPDQGCTGLILGNRADALLLDCPEAEAGVDTPEDWERIVYRRGHDPYPVRGAGRSPAAGCRRRRPDSA